MFDIFTGQSFWDPVIRSLVVAFVSLIAVFIIGTLIGGFMAGKTFRGKSIIETIMMLPLVLPPSVVGFGLLSIFGRNSPIGKIIEWLFHQPIVFTIWAAILASCVVAFPLMYQTIKIGFSSIPEAIKEAAKIDGAGFWRSFIFIQLPLAKQALLTGAVLSFARALGEFGATLMFAGNIPGKTETMPTAIYIAVETNQIGLAWAWVCFTIVISFLLLLVANRFRYK
ncbi:molybdate ABC transporter permease subunit [Scopulibacillus cellulosilyticus]|uniref:Molybdenum transport system permease n=1 Tax=Scopulibacillus cellulosilyticus TaxID=2665665 RepID=A0ABW2PY55_9BACL